MPLYYSAADIFINPTLANNLPFTILEALSCQLPVITSNVGGISEVINHKDSGFLVSSKNPKDIASTINILLHNNKLKNALGKSGRIKVKKYFNLDLYIKKHMRLYKNIIN